MGDEILRQIQSVKWYHKFEVLPGVMTPGTVDFDPCKVLDTLKVSRDLRGKRALDVGTWDGVLAFELEQRGAEVQAVDVQDPDCTAFNTARRLRNSRVKYTRMSVYDLPKVFSEKFDIITYFGVYYHLKHPLMAFESLEAVLADHGRLCFEGEVLLNYSETATGKRSRLNNRALAMSDVPLALCYTGDYKSTSNWFVPNLACLKGWLEATGLEATDYHLTAEPSGAGGYPRQRIMGTARKSAELGVVEETAIFEKNLTLSKRWWEPVLLRRNRTPKASDASRIRDALWGRNLLYRAVRKTVRILTGQNRKAAA